MLNLIPPVARQSVTREYLIRAITVGMFLVGTGCMVVASFFLPTYVLVANQLTAMEKQVAATAAATATYDEGTSALTAAMRQAAILLNQGEVTLPPTRLITILDTLAGSAVELRLLGYTNVGTSSTLAISGQAQNRQALATFRTAIEAHPYFYSADLPISSLIKDRDLLFTMTIITDVVPPAE